MIIITGAIVAKPESFERLRTLSLEHVHRSRTEDGCQLHSVHVDVENPLRLVFVEHWRDAAAIRKHFADPGARGFVAQASQLAASAPEIAIFDASRIDPGTLSKA
ncbi:MAG TPA: putative quinol monooxygenase [Vineibacter sp.]|nr:putative quinol monooxygenase [Vineibacter sp.]